MADPRARNRLLLIIIGSAVFFAYWRRLFLGGMVPFDGNMLRLFVPTWQIGRHLLESGSFLWDPARNMGQPFLASPQNQALYPLRFVTPFISLLNYLRLYSIFHTALLFFPTYLLLKIRFDRVSALTGAGAMAFNGQVLARFTLLPHFATMAWAPLTLLCLSKKRPLSLAFVLAFQWMAGFPPFFILTGAMLLVFAAADEAPRDAFVCLGSGVGAALGLAAVQIVPFVEMLRESARPVFLSDSDAVAYSVHPLELARQFVVPSFMANNLAAVTDSDPAVIRFFGGPVLLALFLLGARKGGRSTKKLAAGALVFFILSLGRYLGFYRYIPFASVFRFPANWAFPALVLMIVVAAAGAAQIKSTRVRSIVGAFLLLDLLVYAFPASTYWAKESFVVSQEDPADALANGDRARRIFHTDLIVNRVQGWTIRSTGDWLLMKKFAVPSIAAAYGWRETISFDVLTSRRAFDYAARLNKGGLGSSLLNYADVGTVVSLTPQGAAKPMPESGDGGPMRNISAAGRAFYADRAEPISITRDTPGEMALQTNAPGTVIASEAFYPGWRAEIDGKNAPQEIFEHMFLAVKVPEGSHAVRFDYRPLSFLFGLGISLLTLIASFLIAAPMRGRSARIDVNERAV